jgi:ribosomal protein L11 methyltransferase
MIEGLPPNGATHIMRLICDAARARSLIDAISETFDSAQTAASAFQRDAAAAEGADDDWVVEVYFQNSPDEASIRALIVQWCGQSIAEALSFGQIAKDEWVAAAQAGLKPVRAGRFVIGPRPDPQSHHTHAVTLAIPAALAFGTGHHGTTFGCLLALQAICKRRRPRRILDVGTGTGILALAAARLLRAPVVCSDIDRTAVLTAAQNARRNGAGPLVRPCLATGVNHPQLRRGAPYDLVFANILAKPLRVLAPALCALTSPTAMLVLSGLLPRDVPGILFAYRQQGFALTRKQEIEGWATLLLSRGGAARRRNNRAPSFGPRSLAKGAPDSSK